MSTQQVSRLSTVRFSLPESLLESVKNMKIVGKDLLFYVAEEDVAFVNQTCSEMGLSVVERVFRLHASAPSEEVFRNVFGDVEHETRESSSRYIATLTVESREEYDRLLSLHGEQEVVVKPFKARYSGMRRSDDDQSDTNEGVQHQRSQTAPARSSQQSGQQSNSSRNTKPTRSSKPQTTQTYQSKSTNATTTTNATNTSTKPPFKSKTTGRPKYASA
jgi:hypothetical protein